MAGARRPEELDVWKLAWELKRRVYAFTSTVPASQDRKFCEDIRRAARSGPDNVAEGFYRFNPKEFHRFLNDARASLGEVRNQLLHAKDERQISDREFTEMIQFADRAIGAATNLQAYLRTCAPGRERRPQPRQTQNRGTAEPRKRTQNPRTQNSTQHRRTQNLEPYDTLSALSPWQSLSTLPRPVPCDRTKFHRAG
jgi:four helix bundle protein